MIKRCVAIFANKIVLTDASVLQVRKLVGMELNVYRKATAVAALIGVMINLRRLNVTLLCNLMIVLDVVVVMERIGIKMTTLYLFVEITVTMIIMEINLGLILNGRTGRLVRITASTNTNQILGIENPIREVVQGNAEHYQTVTTQNSIKSKLVPNLPNTVLTQQLLLSQTGQLGLFVVLPVEMEFKLETDTVSHQIDQPFV